MRIIQACIILVVFSVSLAHATLPPGDAAWARRWWVAKVVRTLRAGQGFSAGEDPSALVAMAPEALAERLVHEPRFVDTILDFNLRFIGFPVDSIRYENGNYDGNIFGFPHAISSAKAFLTPGGDYFSLLKIEQPLYFGPLYRPRNLEPGDPLLDPIQLRDKEMASWLRKLDGIIALTARSPAPTMPEVCKRYRQDVLTPLFDLNLPGDFVRRVMSSPQWFYGPFGLCYRKPAPPVSEFGSLTKRVRQITARFFADFDNYDPTHYSTPDLNGIRVYDTATLGVPVTQTQFTYPVAAALPNSSTNRNRKRGAYILKHYFCDDLTPINVDIAAAHGGTQHASDPKCMACHYKLDPMAGFFRDYGSQFNNFSGQKMLTFDDNVRADRVAYQADWLAPEGTGRKWNVGFIRSTRDEKRNEYGESLGDLFAILRRAPEVKRCLVQRVFEYLVSDNQAVDGDYLDYLTEKFTQNASTSSTEAMRSLVSEIVLSRAFGTPNRKSNQCYDYRPGHVAGTSAPCRVASILEKYCVRCHGSTAASGKLDLKHWQKLAGFPHLDDSGHEITTAETYQRILDRLSSTDPQSRMPYLSDMPSTQRQSLYTWVEQELGENR